MELFELTARKADVDTLRVAVTLIDAVLEATVVAPGQIAIGVIDSALDCEDLSRRRGVVLSI